MTNPILPPIRFGTDPTDATTPDDEPERPVPDANFDQGETNGRTRGETEDDGETVDEDVREADAVNEELNSAHPVASDFRRTDHSRENEQ
jgi:hypothetical protein